MRDKNAAEEEACLAVDDLGNVQLDTSVLVDSEDFVVVMCRRIIEASLDSPEDRRAAVISLTLSLLSRDRFREAQVGQVSAHLALHHSFLPFRMAPGFDESAYAPNAGRLTRSEGSRRHYD